MKEISLEEVKTRSAETQLVEVLPREEFEWARLPGALHVPLRQIDELVGALDPQRPVITYCHDLLCDVGPRAASWLEHNGFADVGDFSGGKMHWLAYGLPYEGSADLVSRHIVSVPTCAPDEPIAEVAERHDGATLVVVVEADGVVVGSLDTKALDGRADAQAKDAAKIGPSTVRPSEEVEKLDKRLADHGVPHIIVSDPGGHLLGMYRPV